MNRTLMLLLGLALAAGLNATLTRGGLARQADLKAQAQGVHQQYLTAESKIRELPTLRTRVRDLETQAAEAQRKFPAEENLGVLIARLQEAAAQDHLTVSTINRATQPSRLPGFTEVQLQVALKGSYPDLMALLDWTQEERRVLAITALNSANAREHRLNVTGYTRNPSPTNPAAQAAPQGASQ